MIEKIDLFNLGDCYSVVLREKNLKNLKGETIEKSYVYYFNYYTSAIEFISGLMNSISYANYKIKIS